MANRYANSDEAKVAALRLAERDATREDRKEEKTLRDNAASRSYYARHIEKCRRAHSAYGVKNRSGNLRISRGIQ
jgi:hypothetical protein